MQFSCFGFGAHCHTVRAYWDTLIEQSKASVFVLHLSTTNTLKELYVTALRRQPEGNIIRDI